MCWSSFKTCSGQDSSRLAANANKLLVTDLPEGQVSAEHIEVRLADKLWFTVFDFVVTNERDGLAVKEKFVHKKSDFIRELK